MAIGAPAAQHNPRIPTADMALTISTPTLTSATRMYWLNGTTDSAVNAVNIEITGANQKMTWSD